MLNGGDDGVHTRTLCNRRDADEALATVLIKQAGDKALDAKWR